MRIAPDIEKAAFYSSCVVPLLELFQYAQALSTGPHSLGLVKFK